MRVLIIDDEPEIRKMLNKMLSNVIQDVLVAEDGQEGLQIVNSTLEIDLVITDLIMPGKEGIETILELKRDRPEIKILAISGGGKVGPHDYLTLAKGLGADLTLTKPFLKEDLCGAVNYLLPQRKQLRHIY